MENLSAEEFIRKVNKFWISLIKEDHERAFWERSAYHVGNMEAYKSTGNDEYLNFTLEWCEANNWKSHPYEADPDSWTWGYGEEESRSVLFADWHTCFQVYLDIYFLKNKNNPKYIEYAKKIIDYQMSKDEDSFWWWADGLFMGMPVMVKLYNLTGDKIYLDKLHQYFKFSMELMYDGEHGIPVSISQYKSTAYSGGPYGGKSSVKSEFSNPENYSHLFYRDASYVYPAKPLPDELSGVKNFWARANGWVFASLARILKELPSSWEHYEFYLKIYRDMAVAITRSQKLDQNGNGFWTQSMLAHKYSSNDLNPEGYETSGTAFFLFGLLVGVNEGFIKKSSVENAINSSWKYLSKIALHESGKIGYVQPVGGEAGKAADIENTQDFGVGASLMAATEMIKYQAE
ncbi:glycoside hydrolase family 88 protein [Marinilactibacillus sp. XAAS-LB27]|uniref:glycoside hydrolase family 88 protein n=1 Tax=Marinilactibacillus sp. XAAS-LB27 TaxID=3114538 RepID=UPI002E188F2F|nr:glycoside hydrolase family 88 protein [Marinilactibacillus sp. XAAS-LB27]